MNIDQIQIGYRYRKDLGDLRSLAQSIAEVGLLHPLVVTPEGRLIAGQRRLEACRSLGWYDIPVTVVDLLQAARGEAHENFVRKDLLPTEIVALKRAIEPLERRNARERQGSRTDLSPTAEKQSGGDTRDNIAHYLGVGAPRLSVPKPWSKPQSRSLKSMAISSNRWTAAARSRAPFAA